MSEKNEIPTVFERVAYSFTAKLADESFQHQLDLALEGARETFLEGPDAMTREQLMQAHETLTASWIVLQDRLLHESASLQAIEWLLYGKNYEKFDGELTAVRVKTEKLQ